MKFSGTRGGGSLSFLDATVQGYPGGGGYFRPEGEADIRTAVYSPAAGFVDVVSLAAAELLSAEVDPFRMASIIDKAYTASPAAHAHGDGLFVLDLASGPTGSAADFGAAFTAAFLGTFLEAGSSLVVAAARDREASALAAAFAGSDSPQRLALLLPEGERLRLPSDLHAACRNRVTILEVRGGLSEARLLERRLSGSMVQGRRCVPAGSATPPRLLGRSLLLVGLFAQARAGLSGDLIIAAPPGDLLGLVTGLWAWSWGLPVTAFLLPRLPGEPSSELLLDLLASCGEPDAAAGAEFLEGFNADYPLGSLVLSAPIGREGAPPHLVLEDGLVLDAASSRAALAAQAALEAGLTGHARIVVPRFADPFWDGAPPRPSLEGAGEGLLSDGLIDPSPGDFSRFLDSLGR